MVAKLLAYVPRISKAIGAAIGAYVGAQALALVTDGQVTSDEWPVIIGAVVAAAVVAWLAPSNAGG